MSPNAGYGAGALSFGYNPSAMSESLLFTAPPGTLPKEKDFYMEKNRADASRDPPLAKYTRFSSQLRSFPALNPEFITQAELQPSKATFHFHRTKNPQAAKINRPHTVL